MAKRDTGRVRKDSTDAVARAGTRERRAPVKTAGTWRAERGKLKEGPFRPGKTAAKRRRS